MRRWGMWGRVETAAQHHPLDAVGQVSPVEEDELGAPDLALVQDVGAVEGDGGGGGVGEAGVGPVADEDEVGLERLGLLDEVVDGTELELHRDLMGRQESHDGG